MRKTDIFIVLILLLSLIQVNTTSANGTGLNPYSGTGDWTISNPEAIENIEMTISGGIIVDPTSGSVSFINCTFYLDGLFRLSSGENHAIINSSIYMSGNNPFQYFEINYSPGFTMKNSIVEMKQSVYFDLRGGDDSYIFNNTISSDTSYGIHIYQTDNTTLRDNNISSPCDSIFTFVSTDLKLINNTITSGSDTNTIYMENCDNVDLINNTLASVLSPNIINFNGVNNYLIKNNSYIMPDPYGGTYNGIIEITGGGLGIITDNVFVSDIPDLYAIYMMEADGISIGNNIIEGYQGVLMYKTNNSVIKNNTIEYANDFGIFLLRTNNNQILGNILYNTSDTGDRGVYISSSNHTIIENNHIEADYIALFNFISENTTIQNNWVKGTEIAIYIRGTEMTTEMPALIHNNTVTGEIQVATHLTGTNITQNRIIADECGIRLYATEYAYLFNNSIISNSTGIILEDSDHNILLTNFVSSNYTGMQLSQSNDNFIDDISIEAKDAISIGYSHDNTISNSVLNASLRSIYRYDYITGNSLFNISYNNTLEGFNPFKVLNSTLDVEYIVGDRIYLDTENTYYWYVEHSPTYMINTFTGNYITLKYPSNDSIRIWTLNGTNKFELKIPLYLPSSPPVINSFNTSTLVIHENESYSFVWSATGPGNYIYKIYLDGRRIDSGYWVSGEEVIHTRIFKMGTYNLTIVFFDDFNNSVSETILIDVVDITPPRIIRIDYGYEYVVGETYVVTVEIDDLHPAYWTLELNGTVITGGNITDNFIFNFYLDLDIPGGLYELLFTVYDTSGNSANMSIEVEVKNDETITKISDTTSDKISDTVSSGIRESTTSPALNYPIVGIFVIGLIGIIRKRK